MAAHEQSHTTIWALINAVLRHRRLLVVLPVSFAAVGLIWWLSASRTYTARASFMPAGGSGSRGSVTAIAQQFGVDIGGGTDLGHSPQLYRTLLVSKGLLTEVALSPYRTDSAAAPTSLLDLLSRDDGPSHLRLESAIRELRGSLDIAVDQATGVVTVSVTQAWPLVAQQIASRMIELVNEFNSRRLREQAEARREFTAQLVDSARRALRDSEDRLEGFINRNRSYSGDPRLSFEHDRLERDVQMRQSVYTSMMSSYEQARVDAIRDTPLITMVEAPMAPTLPNSRGLIRKTIAVVFLGLLIAAAIALILESLDRSRAADSEEYEEYLALRSAAVADARRIVSPVLKTSRVHRTDRLP